MQIYDLKKTGMRFAKYPVLLTEDKKEYKGAASILTFLKTFSDLDDHLTPVQKAQSSCYSSLISETLTDGLLFSWVNGCNADNLRQLCSSRLPWPYNMRFSTNRIVSSLDAKHSLNLSIGDSLNVDGYNHTIHKRIREAYKALCSLIGEKQWCFSTEKPSTLDCYLMAHLLLVMKIPVERLPLSTIIEFEFPIIQKYYKNAPDLNKVLERYTEPLSWHQSMVHEVTELPSNIWNRLGSIISFNSGGNADSEGEIPGYVKEQRLNEFYSKVSVGVALTVFFGYAFSRGIIKVK